MKPIPDPTLPNQESVWAYPRPPTIEATPRHLKISHRGVVLAETSRGVRTLETSHPPTYYFPPEAVNSALISSTARRSFCEWKGWAIYFDVDLGGQVAPGAAWSYPDPTPPFSMLKDHLAFYAAPFDRCTVDGLEVTPQAGGFYGGWITSLEAGPFKGSPGSRFW